MSQATSERPATRRAIGKAATLPVDPREKILCMMKDLIAGACGMVETEEGDCLGRVLDHASMLLTDATNQFMESDSDAAYHTMLDADSFIQSVDALAEIEVTSRKKPLARRTEAGRLADLSAAITTALDQRLADIVSGKAQPITPADESVAPMDALGSAADVNDSKVMLTREGADLIANCTYQIETCILMMQDMARREDEGSTGIHLPIAVQALGVRIEHLNQCIADTVYPSPNGPSFDAVRDTAQGQTSRLPRNIATHAELA